MREVGVAAAAFGVGGGPGGRGNTERECAAECAVTPRWVPSVADTTECQVPCGGRGPRGGGCAGYLSIQVLWLPGGSQLPRMDLRWTEVQCGATGCGEADAGY